MNVKNYNYNKFCVRKFFMYFQLYDIKNLILFFFMFNIY